MQFKRIMATIMSLALSSSVVSNNFADVNICLKVFAEDNQTVEEELKAKLEAYGTVSVWEYHDYDGNGTSEAYGVITTPSGADPDGELYEKIQYVLFIDSDGKITEIHEENPEFLDYVVGTAQFSACSDGQGFFTMAMTAQGPASPMLFYSVKNNTPYKLNLNKKLDGKLIQHDDGSFSAYITKSSPRRYIEYELIYDSSAKEFSLGNRLEFVPSNDKIALATPQPTTFYQVAYPALPTVGDGDTWVVTWEPVENADGYEYHTIQQNGGMSDYFTSTQTTDDLFYYTAGSVPFKNTFKVRSYKILENGETVYSDWSEERVAYVAGAEHDTEETLNYNADAWRIAYKEQLKAYERYHNRRDDDRFSLMYGLDDLNQDGIPELIVSFTKQLGDNSYTLHTYDGKMVLLVNQYFTDETYKNLLSGVDTKGRTYELSNTNPIDEWSKEIGVTTGQCGDDAYWNFDKETGILTISGSGKMYDYATIISEMPWKAYNKSIKKVVVEEGITDFYFNYNQNNQTNLNSFVIPKSVSKIEGITADVDYTLTREVTIYGYTGTEAESYVEKHNDYIEENYSQSDKNKFEDKVKFYPLNGQLLSYISCPDSMVVKDEYGNGAYDTNIVSVSLTIKNNGKYDLSNVFVNLNLPEGVRCNDINAGYEEWNGTNVPKSLPEDFAILDDKNEQMHFSLKQNEKLTFNLVLYISNEVLDRNKTNYAHMVQENVVTFSADIGAYDETNMNTVTKEIISVISTATENIPKSFNIVHRDLINNELSANDVFHFSNQSMDYLNYKDSSQKDYKKKYGTDTQHYYYDSDGKRYYANDFSELELADGERNGYQISGESLNRLLSGFNDNIVKAYVQKLAVENEWGGSCHGMSTVVPLVKGGYLSLSDLGLDSNISKLALPKNDSRVEDLVNFYFLQQRLPYFKNAEWNRSESENNTASNSIYLREIVQETKKVTQGGFPVRIGYDYSGTESGTTNKVSGGHSVVGYKCECVAEMDSNGNHRVVANEQDADFHEYQITIYDCSQTSSNSYVPTYMYIGKDYDYWWYAPVNQGNTIETQTITDVSASTEELNLVDYKTGAKSSICSEHYEKNFIAGIAAYSNVRIKTSNASSKLSDFGEGEGNLYTYTVPDAGTALDADGNEIPCNSFTTYFADDFKDEDITLSLENTDECDFSMIYTNCMVSAGGSKVNEVDMKSAGAVELQADNSDYEVALTFNEGYYTMPWYTVSASGNETNTVSMEKTAEGIVLNSDNMENVTITANNTDEVVELTFTADADNVLITNNKNNLEIYADNDNNGTYETLVKTTDSPSQTTNNKQDTAKVNTVSNIGSGGNSSFSGSGSSNSGDSNSKKTDSPFTGDRGTRPLIGLIPAMLAMWKFRKRKK